MPTTLDVPTAETADTPTYSVTTAADVAALTRRAVTAAFTAENLDRQADRDPTRLSLSGVGGCTRAAAYSIAGTPPTNIALVEDARQAMLGVWIDQNLLPRMAQHLGPDAVIQQPVTLRAGGLTISGTLDLAIPEVVWDLKTVKEWRLVGVRRGGAYSEHRVQVLGYAYARWQAGHPVKWVCWLYMDRATGEVHVEVEPFDNGAALAVINRLTTIRHHAAAPDDAPRDARGPGLSYACDRCPWLTRCYGETAEPGRTGAQKILAATPAGVEKALALYDQAATTASAAAKDKEFAKLILADVPRGTYGAWALDYGRPGTTTDMEQVTADYEELGRPVPKKPTAGRIQVTPTPQPEG